MTKVGGPTLSTLYYRHSIDVIAKYFVIVILQLYNVINVERGKYIDGKLAPQSHIVIARSQFTVTPLSTLSRGHPSRHNHLKQNLYPTKHIKATVTIHTPERKGQHSRDVFMIKPKNGSLNIGTMKVGLYSTDNVEIQKENRQFYSFSRRTV